MSDQVIFELVGGPQDGAKVHRVGPYMPPTIYVGPKWLGDGYATWGYVKCRRFPCRYTKVIDVFVFQGKL